MLLKLQCRGTFTLAIENTGSEFTWLNALLYIPLTLPALRLVLPRAHLLSGVGGVLGAALMGHYQDLSIDIRDAVAIGVLDGILPVVAAENATETLSLGLCGCTLTDVDVQLLMDLLVSPPSGLTGLCVELDAAHLSPHIADLLSTIERRSIADLSLCVWTRDGDEAVYLALHGHARRDGWALQRRRITGADTERCCAWPPPPTRLRVQG